jgi:hypothetical protein
VALKNGMFNLSYTQRELNPLRHSDVEKYGAKNGMSYLLVSLPSSITQAAAYCIKKEMTLVTLETSSDLDIISAIAKGE